MSTEPPVGPAHPPGEGRAAPERRARERGTPERRARERGTGDLPAPEGSSPVPDEVLARRAGLGDKAAFAALITRHGPAVYRYVVRLLHDTDEAQDCVQETMVSAWKNITDFRGDASVRTWLLVLARHEAQKTLRARRRHFPESGSRPAEDFERASAHVADLHANPEGDNLTSELLLALDAALLLLPERARSVWILREVEELSYAEIATVVGITPAAVRGLLSRTRTTVAATMEEWR